MTIEDPPPRGPGLGFAWTILLCGGLALAGDGAARHALGFRRGTGRVLAAAVLAWTWATVGLQLLGTTGHLRRGPLLAWVAIGLALGWSGRLKGRRVEVVEREDRRWGASATVAVGLAAWASLAIGLPSLILPPKIVSDGPIYHLLFAAQWWKAGRIFLVPTPFGETAAPYFPAGGDLWFTWLMVGWGGDRLARVGQSPFLLLAVGSAFSTARRLGASVPSAVVAACWLATCLPLMLFSFEANVDTMFVAGYLVAVDFAIGYGRGGGVRDLVIASLAAGLALGTKATSVVFIPPLLAAIGLVVWLGKRSIGTRLVHLAVVVALPLLPSGYWFARNVLLTGNPLYPMHLVFSGHVLLAGWFPTSAMRYSQFYIPRSSWQAFLDILLSVLDPRLTPVYALLVLGIWSDRRQAAADRRWALTLVAGAVANVALYWLLIPYRTQQRFMLQAVGLMVAPLSMLLDRGRWVRWGAVGLLGLHVLTSQIWPLDGSGATSRWSFTGRLPIGTRPPINVPQSVDELRATLADSGLWAYQTLLIAQGIAAFALATLWGRARSRRGLLVACAATLLMVGLAAWVVDRSISGESRRVFPSFAMFNRGWAELEARSGPSGTRVAYAGTNLPYYLMAGGLRNDVRLVNVDAHRGWLLHDYHREASRAGPATWPTPRPGWDRIHPDEAAWLDNLRAEGIRLLVVARANFDDGPFNLADAEGFPIERVWADAHPERFVPLYGVVERDPDMKIYAIRDRP